MDITDIPFVKHVGIQRDDAGRFFLPFALETQNHLETIHASALFSLAEAASGEALLRQFPELVGNVVPVVRDSQMRFKRPATTAVTAFSTIKEEAINTFLTQFENKGRSIIQVAVEVRDTGGKLVCKGTFDWYVQRLG